MLGLPGLAQVTRVTKTYSHRLRTFPSINNLPQDLAQDPISKNFRVEDGVISNETHHVISDSKGFIWIATDGGICRYDGTKFVSFSLSEGLPERMVTKLHEDKKGRIWFLTLSSYVGYIKNDKVTVLRDKFKQGPSQVMIDDYAHSLYVDEKDTLWVATINSGMLYKLAYPYTGKPEAVHMKSDFVIEFNQKGDYIYGTRLAFCDNDTVKDCEIEVCLTYMQKWKGKTRYFTTKSDFKVGYRTHKIIRVSPDEFYLCTKNGIYSMQNGKLKNEIQLSVVNAYVNKGELWVLTAGYGMYIFQDRKDLSKWKYYYRDQYLTSVTNDIEGGTWLTSLYDGVKYIPDFNFKTLIKEGKEIEQIVVHEDKIIANQKLGDLLVFDKTDLFSRIKTNLFYFSPYIVNGQIDCYTVDKLGVSSEAFIEDWKHIKHKKLNNNEIRMHIKKILRYKNKKYLMNMSRVHVYDYREKKTQPVLLSKSRINNFLIVRDTMWLATNNGLFSYDLKKNKWISDPFAAKNINFRVDDLVATDDGIWFCTFGKGVMYYDKKRKLELFDEKKGLASNYVRSLYLGPHNTLWISTNKGLSRILLNKARKVINYAYLEGYGIGQINSMLREKNDLYLATTNGLYKFPVTQLDKQNKISPVYITGVSSRYINNLQNNTELAYGDDKLKINFLALNYTNARKAEYYYLVKGFDDVWHKTSNLTVSLNKMPPGDYQFIVKTDLNSHDTFNFSIRSPFWQKWWFILLLGFTLLLSVYFVIMQRTKKIKKDEQEKNYIQVQIAGLQANVIRAQMNPHFMFNALNSIQAFILANENKQANFYLGKFSSLMRKIIQVSRHDFVTVKEELRLLQDYIEIERMRCSYSFEYNIRIGNAQSLGVRIPAMIIQPFIENAINHGLSPLEGRAGLLEIGFDMYEQNIICTITDNGIGRIRANEIKQKKIRYHHSASIKLTENRIELYNKLYKAESKISIVDLYDENNEPAGTKVELTIPIIR